MSCSGRKHQFPRHFLGCIQVIDIESLQNRLLKVCYVPTASASIPRVSFFFYFIFLFLQPLTVLMKHNKVPFKQSIFLDVYDLGIFFQIYFLLHDYSLHLKFFFVKTWTLRRDEIIITIARETSKQKKIIHFLS